MLGVMGPLCRVGSANVIINVTYFIKESGFLPQSISYRHLDFRGWHDILSDKLKTKYSILLPLKIFKSCSYVHKQMNTLAIMSAIWFCFCIKNKYVAPWCIAWYEMICPWEIKPMKNMRIMLIPFSPILVQATMSLAEIIKSLTLYS